MLRYVCPFTLCMYVIVCIYVLLFKYHCLLCMYVCTMCKCMLCIYVFMYIMCGLNVMLCNVCSMRGIGV